jgi:hypothetical protein
MQLARINTTNVRPAPAPRRRGRPIGVGRCRQRARQTIAEGIVAGKTVAAIACELGVSRSWAGREAHAPATRELVDALADQYRQTIHTLFESVLNAIAHAIQDYRCANSAALFPDATFNNDVSSHFASGVARMYVATLESKG